MENKTSIHHMMWCRAWYKTPVLKSLRNHPLARNRILDSTHQELHADLLPPPRPTPDMALGAISLLNELRDDGYHTPVNVHLALAEYMFNRREHKATKLGIHIMRQVGYIAESEGLLNANPNQQ